MAGDIFGNWLNGYLTNDATLAGLVEDRIGKWRVEGISSPVYPRVSWIRLQGRSFTEAPMWDFAIQVSAWSDKDYDEAWEIFNQIEVLLNRTRNSSEGQSFVIYQITSPIEVPPDDDTKPIYHVAAHFRVRQLL